MANISRKPSKQDSLNGGIEEDETKKKGLFRKKEGNPFDLSGRYEVERNERAVGSSSSPFVRKDIKQDDQNDSFLFSENEPDLIREQKYGYRKHRIRRRDDISAYNDSMDATYRMDSRKKWLIALAVVLPIAVVVAWFLPSNIFSEDFVLTPASWVELFMSTVDSVLGFITGAHPIDAISIKVYKYIIIAFAGAALGITGAVYQGALKNSLAAPETLGISAGGTVAAMIYVLLITDESAGTLVIQSSELLAEYESMGAIEYTLLRSGQSIVTFCGCMLTAAVVIAISLVLGKGRDGLSSPYLIITGQVFTAVFTSISTLIRYYYATVNPYGLKAQALQSIRVGSFAYAYTLQDLLFVVVPISIGIFVIVKLRKRLMLLTFSDDEARSMGLSVRGTRNLMIVVGTLITAIVISFCGGVSFVGFLIPHLTRRLFGPNFEYLIPGSALVGALFMVAAFHVTSLFSLANGTLTLVTTVAGGLIFIYTIVTKRGRSTADAGF